VRRGVLLFLPNRYYEGNQFKEDEIGREFGMHGGQVVGFWLGILKERATALRRGNSTKCHVNERESEWKGAKLIHLAQDRDKRLALVDNVMSTHVP
jgi:hypothetical protein